MELKLLRKLVGTEDVVWVFLCRGINNIDFPSAK